MVLLMHSSNVPKIVLGLCGRNITVHVYVMCNMATARARDVRCLVADICSERMDHDAMQ